MPPLENKQQVIKNIKNTSNLINLNLLRSIVDNIQLSHQIPSLFQITNIYLTLTILFCLIAAIAVSILDISIYMLISPS